MIQGAPSALDRCKYLISRDTYSGFARRRSFIFCGIVFHWILVCGGHLYFAASSICCLGALSLSAPGKVPPIVGREQSPAAETETSVNCINQFSIIAYIVILYYCIYCYSLRLEICRHRRDRRSCKIFVSCVNFS